MGHPAQISKLNREGCGTVCHVRSQCADRPTPRRCLVFIDRVRRAARSLGPWQRHHFFPSVHSGDGHSPSPGRFNSRMCSPQTHSPPGQFPARFRRPEIIHSQACNVTQIIRIKNRNQFIHVSKKLLNKCWYKQTIKTD